MDVHRSGAWALIAGALLSGVVFALHPAHAGGHSVVGPFTLSQLVHGTALAGIPLLAYGMWQMADWLDLRDGAVRLGLVLAALAMALTANAAVVSNFVTPVAVRATMAGHGGDHSRAAPAPTQMPPLIATSVAMNRGFAQVHVGYWSLALILFGWALSRRRSAILGWSGVAVGLYPLLWQLSGLFSPEVTTMPWVVFPQSAWLIGAAVAMLGRPGEGGAG